MIYLLYTVHVLLCLFLILVVLLQQGKGADLSVFGGGSTMTAFGARSATSLLHRLTVGAFVGFVLTTLSIAYIKANVEGISLMSGAEEAAPAEVPIQAAPGFAEEAEEGAPVAPAAESEAPDAPPPTDPDAPAESDTAPPPGSN